MHLLVDCTQISKKKAGVGVYALNLVRELAETYPGLTMSLLAQGDDQDFDIKRPNVTLIKVPAWLCRKLLFRFVVEQLYIPLLTILRSFDVVHSLHYSFPLCPLRAKKVVTIHDLTSYTVPEHLLSVKRAYVRFFLKCSRRLADQLIFVSKSTQNDYLQRFSRKLDGCHVVQLGKGPDFRVDLDRELVEQVCAKHTIRKPYILSLGMIEPRKNLARLIEAFSIVNASYPGYTLVIAGSKGWMYDGVFEAVHRHNISDRVIFTGFVQEKDKPFLIRGAQIFAYPSLYEGFGIPVLEAIACGIPTITSNISSLPEVAGDAALLVDPTSVIDISNALERLMSDQELREELSRKCVIQAAKFSWKRAASETALVYQQAVVENRFASSVALRKNLF